MGKDFIELVIDYTHNTYACSKHKHELFLDLIPAITRINGGGWYVKKDEEIENLFLNVTRAEILQIVARKELNILQLKKILKYSYPTIYNHLKSMEKLRLIEMNENISEKGKKEVRVKIHKNVKISTLSDNPSPILEAINGQIKYCKNSVPEFDTWLDSEIQRGSKQKTIRRSMIRKRGNL